MGLSVARDGVEDMYGTGTRDGVYPEISGEGVEGTTRDGVYPMLHHKYGSREGIWRWS